MPRVEVEHASGDWKAYEVSAEERRSILAAAQPEQRFIKDGVVYIAHPHNPWCWHTDHDGYVHVWNETL